MQRFLSSILAGMMLLMMVWQGSHAEKLSLYPRDLHQDPGSTNNPPQMDLLYDGEEGLVLDIVTYDYRLDKVSLATAPGSGESGYDSVAIPGAEITATPGSPQLPVLTYLLGIPSDADPILEVFTLEGEAIPGSYRLPPAPRPSLDGSETQPSDYPMLEYVEDPQAYASWELFPMQSARLGETAWLRDQRILRLEVYPFQVRPETGELFWNRRLRVSVSFREGAGMGEKCLLCLERSEDEQSTSHQAAIHPSMPGDSPFEGVLRSALVNYESAQRWRGIPQDTVLAPLFEPGETAYRIPIADDGVYRLTYEALGSAGLDVVGLDPTLLHLTSQGQEVAYYLHNVDGNLHQFSPGEYIVFYGEKLYGDRLAELYSDEDSQWLTFPTQDISGTYTTWSPQYNATMVEKYTDENVYWLSLEEQPGLQMDKDTGPGEAPLATSYRAVQRAEHDIYKVANLYWTSASGEANWYWSRNSVSNPISATWTYTTTLSGLAPGDLSATIRGELISVRNNDAYSPDHHTIFYLNDPDHLIPLDERYWDGKSRYRFEQVILQENLMDGENQLDLVAYKTDGSTDDELYFDWFEIEYQRSFQAVNNELGFSPEQPGDWRYRIEGFSSSDVGVLRMNSTLTPTWITNWSWNGGILDFKLNSAEGERIYAGKMTVIPAGDIQPYSPPDLSAPADYLVISHANFVSTAQNLADYRQSKGLTAQVVDVQDLYNQFNFGIFNPIAVKNFLRYAFQTWPQPPAYVVLVGDGTWNLKGSPRYYFPPIYMPPNQSWIDPWYGELDSANQLAAVVGDDPLPDASISRMPVNSAAELDAIIDKSIAYESAPIQDWQRRFLFVADNVPDSAGDFVHMSDSLIADYQTPGFTYDTIYENDLDCPFNDACPAATAALTHTLNTTGTLVLDYIGHGSINRWSSESVLTNADIASLDNGDRLPVVLSMTCNDGFWSYTGIAPNPLESLMEEMLRAPGKGMVASLSPTGFSVATGQDTLQRGFFDALLRNGQWGLTQAATSARLRLFAAGSYTDLIHTYTIFGDPALQLPNPFEQRVYLPVMIAP